VCCKPVPILTVAYFTHFLDSFNKYILSYSVVNVIHLYFYSCIMVSGAVACNFVLSEEFFQYSILEALLFTVLFISTTCLEMIFMCGVSYSHDSFFTCNSPVDTESLTEDSKKQQNFSHCSTTIINKILYKHSLALLHWSVCFFPYICHIYIYHVKYIFLYIIS
jgi:hypothetical protein